MSNLPESPEYKKSLDNLGIRREYKTMTVSHDEWHKQLMSLGSEEVHVWLAEKSKKWAEDNAPDWATHYVYDPVWYGCLLKAVGFAYFDRKMAYEMEKLK